MMLFPHIFTPQRDAPLTLSFVLFLLMRAEAIARVVFLNLGRTTGS